MLRSFKSHAYFSLKDVVPHLFISKNEKIKENIFHEIKTPQENLGKVAHDHIQDMAEASKDASGILQINKDGINEVNPTPLSEHLSYANDEV